MEQSSGQALSYIIGGSSGMGLATAHLLVDYGSTVVIVGRERQKVDLAKTELEGHGRGRVETITADLSEPSALKDLSPGSTLNRDPSAIWSMPPAISFQRRSSNIRKKITTATWT